MALPIIPLALKGAASLIARRGATEAIKKYGKPTVKKAQEAIAKRQKAIDAKTLGKPSQPSKGSQARSAETNKVKARNKRLEEEMKGKERFDIDGDPLDEVPLRFDMYSGGLLSDDRQKYGLGAIVKKFLKKNPNKNTKKIKKLEKEMDGWLEDYRKLNDDYDQAMRNAKKEGMSTEQIKDLDETYNQYYRLYDDNLDMMIDELDEVGIKVSAKNIKARQVPSSKESGDYKEPLEQLNNGGLLSDDRQRYGLGSIVKSFIKQAEKNKKKKMSKSSMADDSTDMAERGAVSMNDAIKMLDDGEEVGKVQDFLIASGYTKKDAKKLIDVYRADIDIAKPNMTQDEILDEIDRLGLKDGGPGIEALRKEAPKVVKRMGYEDGGSMDDQMMMVMNVEPMESDDFMESNYTQFIMEEALSEDEEDMLVSKLEKDEELQMLFDKVIDVAQEFAGSGPVDGPGSGVSDSIPARLSDGEFVFTAKAVEEIGEDKLMSMMKEAEANADERQEMMHGGTLHKDSGEEEIQANTNRQQVMNQGTYVPEEDTTVRDKVRENMMDPNTQSRYVRS